MKLRFPFFPKSKSFEQKELSKGWKHTRLLLVTHALSDRSHGNSYHVCVYISNIYIYRIISYHIIPYHIISYHLYIYINNYIYIHTHQSSPVPPSYIFIASSLDTCDTLLQVVGPKKNKQNPGPRRAILMADQHLMIPIFGWDELPLLPQLPAMLGCSLVFDGFCRRLGRSDPSPSTCFLHAAVSPPNSRRELEVCRSTAVSQAAKLGCACAAKMRLGPCVDEVPAARNNSTSIYIYNQYTMTCLTYICIEFEFKKIRTQH